MYAPSLATAYHPPHTQESSPSSFVLDKSEARALAALASGVDYYSSPGAFERFQRECAAALAHAPTRLRDRLFQYRTRGEDYLLLRGLPQLTDAPPTPTTVDVVPGPAEEFARKVQGIVSSALGYVYAFASKKVDDFFTDVYPIARDAQAQVGTNSVFLNWHVEDGFHRTKPDYIALYCLRADPTVETLLFRSRSIRLDAQTMQILRSPSYSILSDTTFAGQRRTVSTVSVLDDSDDPEIVFDPSFMKANTPAAQDALDALERFIHAHHESIVLARGDLLVFDNRRVAHGRVAYRPRFDGSDRWLVRTTMVESMWKAKDTRLGQLFVVK